MSHELGRSTLDASTARLFRFGTRAAKILFPPRAPADGVSIAAALDRQ
jgi:hypothetical protein